MNISKIKEITNFYDLYISKDGKLRIGNHEDKNSPLYKLEDIQNKICKTEVEKILFITGYANKHIKIEQGVTIANILEAIEPWSDYFSEVCNGKNIKSYINEFKSLDFKEENQKIIYIAKTISPTLQTSIINKNGEKLSKYKVKKGLQKKEDFKEVQNNSIEENEYIHISVYQNPYNEENRNNIEFSLNDAKNIPVIISDYKYILVKDSEFSGTRASINYQDREIIKVKYEVSLNELILWIMDYGLFWHDTARYKEIEKEIAATIEEPIDLSTCISAEELEEIMEEKMEKRIAQLPKDFEPLYPKILRELLKDVPDSTIKGIEIQKTNNVLLFGKKIE